MKGRISNKLGEIRINPEVIAKYAGITAVECRHGGCQHERRACEITEERKPDPRD